MPIEIKVGPPVLTISQGRTFMVSDPAGGVDPATAQGVYMNDTRFVSYYSLSVNNSPLELVNSGQTTFYASRIHLTNPAIHLESGMLAQHMLHVTLDRKAREGSIHEDLNVANYTGKAISFLLELTIHVDFADIFEVRSHAIVRRGQMVTHWNEQTKYLRTSYDNGDFHRAFLYCVLDDVPVSYSNGRLCFAIHLEPNQCWHTCGEMMLEHSTHIVLPFQGCCHDVVALSSRHRRDMPDTFAEQQASWQDRCTGVITSNSNFQRMYTQAVDDMRALRIYDMDISEDIWVPAAGVPWFVTLFGRDSLIVSYQCMSLSTGFAPGALKWLAQYQATERDDWRDAQPGKILHEIRFGELAYFRRVPFTPYYGTADATILYLIVLSETYRWTGDRAILQTYREVAERCLAWVDQYGDLDGDGFQEYKTFSTPGYENLGWKDAWDAVVYADGSQVKQPKALCELQAYVYDAKLRLAEIFVALGEEERAATLQEQAATLKQRFNQLFWLENEGCFAYGLDSEKKQIDAIASNAGHCLWSGIADPEKAALTARRLLQEDMWSGWGIRTLASSNPAYNPFSYQNGSVWPQDNGIIAEGFKRYGLAEQSNKVIRGILDAIEHFESSRPPEVFAGIQRAGELDFPVLYPDGANIPQAWATASIFHMLRTILGLRADAPNRRLYVNPTLPDWLPDVEIQRLRVGNCMLGLRFWREGKRSHWKIVSRQVQKREEMVAVLDESDAKIYGTGP